MTRKSRAAESSGYTILLVDDNVDYLAATRRLLEREGHTLLTAKNGQDTLEIVKRQKVDLLLLDYYMPGMTGEQVLGELRKFNQSLQVILQTGYASEQPPRELLHRLDIQGYYDKSEGPEKLLLWTDVGLKAAYTVQLLTKSRQGLQYILDVTPDMHKIQPLTDLLQGILLQVTGLLGIVNSFLAVLDEGGIRTIQNEQAESFIAMIEEDTDLVIRASTGRFVGHAKVNEVLSGEGIKAIYEILKHGGIKRLPETTIVPLKIGELTIGMIYLDRQVIPSQDQELLNIFANQAAVAIQNTQLYEMATVDQLTGLFVRNFLEKWLYRELRTAFRSLQPLSLLLVDLDGFKKINDEAGHLAGDQALALVGKVMRDATRNTDFLGRYGGDEFIAILPQTEAEGARVVGQRIINSLKEQSVIGPKGKLSLSGSIGMCVLEPPTLKMEDSPYPIPSGYFENMGHRMIKQADEALYKSKSAGGSRLQSGVAMKWQPLTTKDR